MTWDFNNYLFWAIQVPSTIVLWTCAVSVSIIFLKATLQAVFRKRGNKSESK